MSRQPRVMRTPKTCRPCFGTDEGWYYVQPGYIEVIGRKDSGVDAVSTTAVRLTRRQLERALEIMDEA